MGFSPLATLAGVLEMAARGFVSYLVPVFGFAAACYASPAAWCWRTSSWSPPTSTAAGSWPGRRGPAGPLPP